MKIDRSILALMLCLSLLAVNGLQSAAYATSEVVVTDEMLVININSSTAEDLQQINGIGPKLANRIIEYRAQNGDFLTSEDIMSVRGIGEAKYAKIKNTISV